MLILSLVTVGAFSFFSLGLDLFPKIDFPTITVTVVNPGASPQEIETDVTEKIEEAVNTISGIDELRSTSIEGVSQVFAPPRLFRKRGEHHRVQSFEYDLVEDRQQADRPTV